MKALKKSQAGFGLLGIISVVLVVAVIAGVGVFVASKHHKSSLSSTTSNSKVSTKPNTTANTTQTQQQAQQYMVIKEWGVQLPLSGSISDAYYSPTLGSSKGSDGAPNQLSVGLKSMDTSGCAVSANAAPVTLFRVSPTEVDPVSGKPVSQEGPGTTIGSYFYGYSLNKTKTCNSETTFATLDSELTDAIKRVAPSN